MPSRILRDTLVTSESVASLPPDVQDRLHRYFLLADDFGCFRLQPAVIKGAIFALRPEMTEERIAADLEAYASVEIVRTWQADDGKRYCGFPNWNRHQRQAKPGTRRKTPAPPWESGNLPELPGTSRNLPELPGTSGRNPVSRARARSQSQAQSQSQSQEKTAVAEAPAARLASGSKKAKATAAPAPTAEEVACRKALRERIAIEYAARTGVAFKAPKPARFNRELAELATALGNDPEEAGRVVGNALARADTGDRFWADVWHDPRLLLEKLPALRGARPERVSPSAAEPQGRAPSLEATAERSRQWAAHAAEVKRLQASGFKPPPPVFAKGHA